MDAPEAEKRLSLPMVANGSPYGSRTAPSVRQAFLKYPLNAVLADDYSVALGAGDYQVILAAAFVAGMFSSLCTRDC